MRKKRRKKKTPWCVSHGKVKGTRSDVSAQFLLSIEFRSYVVFVIAWQPKPTSWVKRRKVKRTVKRRKRQAQAVRVTQTTPIRATTSLAIAAAVIPEARAARVADTPPSKEWVNVIHGCAIEVLGVITIQTGWERANGHTPHTVLA